MRITDHDPVRDVTMLMMVRHMPDEDFRQLCNKAMEDPTNTLVPFPNIATRCDALRHHATRCDSFCDCCAEPIRADALTAAFVQATGIPACKACIDEALFAIFGPSCTSSPLVRHTLRLAEAHA